MSTADWLVLIATLSIIIGYGLYKSKSSKDLEGYFLSNRQLPWYLVLLSIMGTQASAITFLSAPGQAFTDGMRFVQYYLGLPLAMIVISISFLPIFQRLQVFTAYEYLEQRFDKKTRGLTVALFLLQRGLSTGISIYAPAIILSSLLGWNIYITNAVMGGLLIIYTMSGGARAVAFTQQLQLIIIFCGMFLAAYTAVALLPNHIHFSDALRIGGESGKLNVITSGFTEKGFDFSDRYNIWSGIIGGFFLALSYFGTDQSQVGRYLTAKSLKESRLGVLMNGFVKVPMQFLILLVGVLVFSFYQFKPAPLIFNPANEQYLQTSTAAKTYQQMQSQYDSIAWLHSLSFEKPLLLPERIHWQNQKDSLRKEAKQLLKSAGYVGDTNDSNYIFLRFVVDYLPKGLVGLLIAVIFLAAWGSIAAALNSLAGSTMIDVIHNLRTSSNNPAQDYQLSKWVTLCWGVFSIVVAMFATNMGSLIEAVNILGSLFYGTMLGIFLVAFYLRRVGGNAVFYAALIAELLVIILFKFTDISFLWMNAIGALAVMALAILFTFILPSQKSKS